MAKYPFAPPAAPECPECRDVMRDSMTVTWREPISDGGGVVTGYYLELLAQGGRNWTKLNKKALDAKDRTYKATGLTKDKTYFFR